MKLPSLISASAKNEVHLRRSLDQKQKVRGLGVKPPKISIDNEKAVNGVSRQIIANRSSYSITQSLNSR
jgi:hypothetical protein